MTAAQQARRRDTVALTVMRRMSDAIKLATKQLRAIQVAGEKNGSIKPSSVAEVLKTLESLDT